MQDDYGGRCLRTIVALAVSAEVLALPGSVPASTVTVRGRA
jgi:hypothetical protein